MPLDYSHYAVCVTHVALYRRALAHHKEKLIKDCDTLKNAVREGFEPSVSNPSHDCVEKIT
jgi:hypothetical protein